MHHGWRCTREDSIIVVRVCNKTAQDKLPRVSNGVRVTHSFCEKTEGASVLVIVRNLSANYLLGVTGNCHLSIDRSRKNLASFWNQSLWRQRTRSAPQTCRFRSTSSRVRSRPNLAATMTTGSADIAATMGRCCSAATGANGDVHKHNCFLPRNTSNEKATSCHARL